MKNKTTKMKWTTMKFTYEPPTPEQTAINDLTKKINSLEKLRHFMNGIMTKPDIGVEYRSATYDLVECISSMKSQLSELTAKQKEAKK